MSVVECKTADDVRALARRYRPPVTTPVVRLHRPVKVTPAKPLPKISEIKFETYGTSFIRPWLPVHAERIKSAVSAPRFAPRVNDIIAASAKHFKIGKGEIISQRRSTYIVIPRHVAMYLARELTGHSLPTIGKFMGNRDHTTIYNGWLKTKSRMEANQEFAESVSALRRKLEGGE